MSPQIENFKIQLEAYLSAVEDAEVSISTMQQLAGGASRDSWSFTAIINGEAHNLVLRKDFPTTMNDKALTRRQEYQLMHAAHQSGVKVAQMRYQSSNPDILGLPFFIMTFVPGISIGRKVIKDPALEHARSVLPEQMAEQLARIHQMDLTAHNIDFLEAPAPGKTPSQSVLDHARQVLDDLGVQSPTFEFALHWAEQHQPPPHAVTFVHGDFRIGNLLVDENGLAAVIDWEFGHIGDPLEEIGYLCMRDWRFGNDHLHAAGLCQRERFIKAYEAHSGTSVDRSAVDWWEIVGNIRWGMICLAQAERHLSGKDPSVELASLGRRSAEMQLEALNLIDKVGQ